MGRMCKSFINKLICLCKGHKWKGPYYLSDKWDMIEVEYECARCGKIKEEVI